jgi:hypothetical protein
MESHDEYYEFRNAVRNLMQLKMAFDYGIKLEGFATYLNDFYGDECDWDILIHTINEVFTIADYWTPHSGDDDIEDKEYWCNVAGYNLRDEDHTEETGVLVILDDRIDYTKLRSGSCGGGSDFYNGFAEIMPIPNGIVMTWDEGDGAIDLVDVTYYMLAALPYEKERN